MKLGVNHLLLSMLTLNFKIVPKTLVSEMWGGPSSFVVHANSFNFKNVPETVASKIGGSIIFYCPC